MAELMVCGGEYSLWKILEGLGLSLQQNVTTVTNFSEEKFFVTKKYHIVTKFIFRH